jgi:imidazoleglycerol-phosphate dehydratase
MRTAKIERETGETNIQVGLKLDGVGKHDIKTGCGFLSHMLELFARHGRFDLLCYAEGDTHVDYHHLAEDTGIVLGRAFASALGDMRGIMRYGSFLLPMDEALVMVALDISGRAHLTYDVQIPAEKIGDFDTELAEEFLLAFTRSLGLTLHVKQMAGRNSHHIIEAMFKGLARALMQAVSLDERFPDDIPSTKGTIL